MSNVGRKEGLLALEEAANGIEDEFHEKIVAQHPKMKEPCCITLCQLFLKKDESLQKKAANFISKYGEDVYKRQLLASELVKTYQAWESKTLR